VTWRGHYGVADVTTGAPVTDDTVFCLASLGKTMVAALTLAQVSRGLLLLDEPVGRWLPDVPGAGVVTPRMLLTHTSGYPDIYESPELAPLFPSDGEVENGGTAYDPDREFTWEMLRAGFREPVDPGRHWAYSNGGFIVLTELLLRLLGGPEALADAWTSLAARSGGTITDDVLTPHRSRVALDRLSHGYVEQPDGTVVDAYAAHPAAGVTTDLFGLPFGDGLFAGTAVGSATFLHGLFVRRTVLDPDTVTLMTTTTPQAAAAGAEAARDAAQATYGMGAYRREAAGGTWAGHQGTYGGFNVIAMADAERGETLAVLTNVMGDDARAVPIWQALAEALDPAPDPAPAQVDVRATDAAGSARTR
jgi:CubicO group peptidase (beta-lactamase class C family)